ncbi:hypothetical protein LCL95_11905 [Bacillus timonensis]|nr:hypothetical protein [Bacillus timonensis]
MRALLLLTSILFVLAGCQSSHQLYEVRDVPKTKEKGLLKASFIEANNDEANKFKTLNIVGETFNTVGDWYDNNQILYVTDQNGKSNIYRFNLNTGETSLFYSSEVPILTLKANEDQSLFLIHTSKSKYTAEVIILDKLGNKTLSWQFESFDLFYSWNANKKDQLFITSFLDDWSFQSYVVDVTKKSVKEFSISQPFVQWIYDSNLIYMMFKENEPSLTAPLYLLDLGNQEEELIFNEIISFTSFNDYLLTVELAPEDESKGVYKFFKGKNLEKTSYSFTVPLLTDYSKMHIPYFTFNSNKGKFYTFEPYDTGSFDTYDLGFKLISYSVSESKIKTVLEEVDSMPINVSPNGNLILYGYQFEQIIDVKAKRIVQLINF